MNASTLPYISLTISYCINAVNITLNCVTAVFWTQFWTSKNGVLIQNTSDSRVTSTLMTIVWHLMRVWACGKRELFLDAYTSVACVIRFKGQFIVTWLLYPLIHPSICLYHTGYWSQPELTALRYELWSSKVWSRAIWSGLESPCGSQIVTPPSSLCNKQSPSSLKPCSPVEAWPNVSVEYTKAEHFHITIFITIIIESFVAKQAVCCRNTKTHCLLICEAICVLCLRLDHKRVK